MEVHDRGVIHVEMKHRQRKEERQAITRKG